MESPDQLCTVWMVVDPTRVQIEEFCTHCRRSKQSELDAEHDKVAQFQRELERRLLDLEGDTQAQREQLMADFEQVREGVSQIDGIVIFVFCFCCFLFCFFFDLCGHVDIEAT